MFLGKIDTPSTPKEGENFAYRADTDVSVHCDFVLSHCGPTPKANDDPVEIFRNGFATRHEIQRQQNQCARVQVQHCNSARLGAPPISVLKPVEIPL